MIDNQVDELYEDDLNMLIRLGVNTFVKPYVNSKQLITARWCYGLLLLLPQSSALMALNCPCTPMLPTPTQPSLSTM